MSQEWGHWECPTCHDECEDPQNIYVTVCHNNHQVILAHEISNGWRTAFLDVERKGE